MDTQLFFIAKICSIDRRTPVPFFVYMNAVAQVTCRRSNYLNCHVMCLQQPNRNSYWFYSERYYETIIPHIPSLWYYLADFLIDPPPPPPHPPPPPPTPTHTHPPHTHTYTNTPPPPPPPPRPDPPYSCYDHYYVSGIIITASHRFMCPTFKLLVLLYSLGWTWWSSFLYYSSKDAL